MTSRLGFRMTGLLFKVAIKCSEYCRNSLLKYKTNSAKKKNKLGKATTILCLLFARMELKFCVCCGSRTMDQCDSVPIQTNQSGDINKVFAIVLCHHNFCCTKFPLLTLYFIQTSTFYWQSE